MANEFIIRKGYKSLAASEVTGSLKVDGLVEGTSLKLSNGFTISEQSGGYAALNNWVKVDDTGFYTTTNINMDLDDSTSIFRVRGTGNATLFKVDTSQGSGKAFFYKDVRLSHEQNAGSRLELYNNRQDAGNVEIYRIAAYNSAEVAGIHFYRGSGGDSGYTKVFAKRNNASNLEEVVQFGSNDSKLSTFAGGITSAGTIIGAADFKATGNNLKLHAGGNHILNIDLNGKIYPSSDAAKDLGYSTSAYRFRHGYFSGNVYAGNFHGDGSNITGVTAEWDGSHTGNASITGNLTITGNTQAPKFIAAQGTTYANGYQLTRTGHDTYRICLGNSEGLRIVNETDSNREELAFDGAGNATFAGTVGLSSNKSVNWPGGSIRAEGNTLKLTATTLIDLQEDTQIQGGLDIKQTSDSNGLQIFGYDDRAADSGNLYVDSAGNFQIRQTHGAGSGYMQIHAENYLELGASTLIYTQANFRIYDAGQLSIGSGGDYKIKHNPTPDNLVIHTDDNKGITIDNAGNVTFTEDVLMPTAGQQLRIGSFTDGSSNNGEYVNDDLVIGDGSISIYPHRRGDYGLNESTATSTTFRSKLNIWSDNEDHITFGGASTHMVSAWETWKIWINNDSASNGIFKLYHTNAKTEFARFSGDGTTSFITGKFTATKELTVSSVATTNGSPATDNISVSGYGMIGNRGSVYLTNANTDSASSVQIGVGGVHAAATKLLINPSNSIFSTNVRVGADSTYSLGTSAARWADVYADFYYGDGSNLTGVTVTDNTKVSLTGDETIAGVKQFSNYINAAANIQISGHLYNTNSLNSIDLIDHGNYTWFRNAANRWIFQGGAAGDDWTQAFAFTLESVGSGYNDKFMLIGQQQNNGSSGGRYKGIRIVKSTGSSTVVDGDLQAGIATFSGDVTATKFKLNNNTNNTNADSFAVYDDGGSVSYGMTLWNTDATSGEWATMIYGPNQTSRRISFGKANSNFGTNHAGIDELAFIDLDNGNFHIDGAFYGDGSNLTGLATENYVDTAVSNLIDNAPANLNTLNELAEALNDDDDAIVTINTALGNRVRVDTASQGLNSTQKSNARTNIGAGTSSFGQGSYSAGYTGDMDSLTGFRVIRSTSGSNRAFSAHHNVITIPNTGSTQYGAQLAFETGTVSDGGIKFRSSTNGTFTSWYRLYHEGHKPTLTELGAQASGNYITGTGSLSAQDLTDIGNLSGTNTGDQDLSGYLTSYSETDTLDTVADRGATTNQALSIGASATSGGRVLSQNYSGANRLGVISSNSSSGNFLIGYGAEGKVGSSGNFVSTYGNFSGGHAALSISGTHLRWYAEASNSTTTIGDDLTLANVFSVDRLGNLALSGTVDGVDIAALPTTFAPTNAEANVQSDWNATSGDALILNKPTIPTDHGDHDGLYLPIGGGTMTGDIVMQDEMVNFAAGNPELPNFRGKRSNTDLDDRQWGTEGAWSYTTFESNTTNKPSSGLHNANGLLSFNTHAGDSTNNYFHQIAMTTNTNKLWHRRRNGASFGSWEEIFKGSVPYSSVTGTPTIPTDFVSAANGGTFSGNILVNAQLAVNSTTVNAANKLEVHGQARINGKMMIGDSTISNVPNAAVQLHVKNAGQAGIRLEDSDSSNLAFDVIVDEGVGFLIKETVGGDAGDDVRLTIAESTGAVTIGGTLGSGAITSTGKISGTELEGTSLDINGNGDISGTLNIGDEIITTAGGSLFKKYVSSWTGRENQDIIYQGWHANTDDYIYLKAPGNSSTNHGVAFISDNVIAFGRTDIETGAPELTSAAAPISENWLVLNSSAATFAGDLTVAGTITAQEFHTEFVSASIMYESGSTKFGDSSDDVHNFTGSVNIDGTLSATVKSFDIVHPTQEGKRLVYGVLEGPEHAVYVRGESKEDTVILPEEWKGLVDKDTLTVQLTPIGSPDIYYYKNYENNSIIVGGPEKKHYFYYVQATRKDVEPLITVQ